MGAPEPLRGSTGAGVGATASATVRAALGPAPSRRQQLHHGPQHAHRTRSAPLQFCALCGLLGPEIVAIHQCLMSDFVYCASMRAARVLEGRHPGLGHDNVGPAGIREGFLKAVAWWHLNSTGCGAAGAFSPHSMASTAFGGTMANDSVADLQALPEADGVDMGSSAPSLPAASPQMPSPFRTPAMQRTPASPTPQLRPPPDAK